MIFQRVMFAFVALGIIFVSGFTSREGASTTKAVASTTGEEPQVLELTFPGDFSTMTVSTKDAIKASIKTEVETGTGAGTVESVTLEAGSIIATVTFDSSVTTAQVRASVTVYTNSPMVLKIADDKVMTSIGVSFVGVTEEGDKETPVVTTSPSPTTAPTASPSTAPTASPSTAPTTSPTQASTRYRDDSRGETCYTDECWCVSAGGNSCGVNEDEECVYADACHIKVDCPGNGYRCASGADDCAADDCWCVSVGGTSCGAGNDEQCKEDICHNRGDCQGNGYTCVNKKPKQKACAADECWCVSDGGFSCGTAEQTCLEDECFEAAQCPGSGYRCKIDET